MGEAVSDALVIGYCIRSQAFIGVGKQEVRVSNDRLEDLYLEGNVVWGRILHLNRLVNFLEKMPIQSSICGGMSLRGGFQDDLTYSLEGHWVNLLLGSPAKKVLRWMSCRSCERVLVRSDVVYFGVWMNLNPRPRISWVWWGTLL